MDPRDCNGVIDNCVLAVFETDITESWVSNILAWLVKKNGYTYEG